ncbi:MAG: hypothetical protein ACRDL5_06310 [Solirubrobacteraceae bacterium]
MSAEQPTVADLARWLEFGAGLRIVQRHDGGATYEMCTCTGESVERHESDDPGVIEYLVAHAERAADPG